MDNTTCPICAIAAQRHAEAVDAVSAAVRLRSNKLHKEAIGDAEVAAWMLREATRSHALGRHRRPVGSTGSTEAVVVWAVAVICAVALVLIYRMSDVPGVELTVARAAHAGLIYKLTDLPPTTLAPTPPASPSVPSEAPTVAPAPPLASVATTSPPAPPKPAVTQLRCQVLNDGSPGQGGTGIANWYPVGVPSDVVAANPTRFRSCQPWVNP